MGDAARYQGEVWSCAGHLSLWEGVPLFFSMIRMWYVVDFAALTMQTAPFSPSPPHGVSRMSEAYYARWGRLHARERRLFHTARRLASAAPTRGTPASLAASAAWLRASGRLTAHECDHA